MNKNMNTIDRLVRIVAAVALGILIFTETVTGLSAIVLGVLAAVLLLTGVISFCPLYALFKFSTRRQAGAK
jgi:hypothetical protein